MLTLTSVIELRGQLARGKPPVSWRPSLKDLCQCWITHFAKHFSPYASCNKAHVSSISFPNQIEKSIAAYCLERMTIFSLFHTNQHTLGFTETTLVCYTCHTQCWPVSFERYTLPLHTYVLPNAVSHSPPFLRCIHLNISLFVGICQHVLTKLTISRRLFHIASWFHTLSTRIKLQNTNVYGNSPIKCAGSTYEWRAKTYGKTSVGLYEIRVQQSLKA